MVGIVDYSLDQQEEDEEHNWMAPQLIKASSARALHLFRSHSKQQVQKEDLRLEVDLIRKDAGRSVLFRYRNSYPEDDEDILSSATPSGQETRHDDTITSASSTPPFATERLAHVLEQAITKQFYSADSGKLHYYQGLHDLAGVLLYSMDYDTKATIQLLQRLSNSHLRDFLRESFGNVTWLLQLLLLPLVERIDPQVHYALVVSQVELSNVCLSWLITWFTHDIHSPAVATRLLDAFIASHPLLPFYLVVALMTHPLLKRSLLQPEALDDPAMLFMILKQLPHAISADTTVQDESTVLAQDILEDALAIM